VGLVIHRPGRDLVVSRGGPNIHAHEDVYAALRDSFDATERQLAEHDR
jgi:hypothetical protein